MRSWPNSESSEDSWIGLLHEVDYAPETIEDPLWCGIALDCTETCRLHNVLPERFVAFEGTNVGRRFYGFSVRNDAINWIFIRWVDIDWEPTLERSLERLWQMYEESKNARVEEKEETDRLVEELMIQKDELQRKHNKLIKDSNAWFDALEKKMVLENVEKMNRKGGEEGSGSEIEALKKKLEECEIERDALKNDVSRMKTEAEEQQRERELQYNALKEEKKNIEYKLFDLLKAGMENKDKLKRIKLIMDE